MSEHPNPRDLALQYLFTQLCRLSPAGDDTAASMTLRTGTHQFVGDVHLSDEDVAALTIAVESLADAKVCTEENSRPGLYADPAMPPLPIDDEPLLDVDDKDVEELLREVDEYVHGEQL